MQFKYLMDRLELLQKRYMHLDYSNVRCAKINDLMFLIIDIDDNIECICLNNEF